MSKKFLYTDKDSLKSVAAQLYEGILLEHDISEGESQTEGMIDTYGTSENKGERYSASLKAVLGGELEGSQNNTSHENKSINENASQIFNESKKIAQDEYLFNIVQNSLKEKGDLKDKDNANQYDYISFNDDFLFFDFSVIKNSIDHRFLLPLVFADGIYMKEYDELVQEYNRLKKVDKQKENANNIDDKKFREKFKDMQVFKSLNSISSHLDNILANHFILIDQQKSLIIIGDKAKLKLPSMALTLNKKMKLDAFGIVISNDKQVMSQDFQGQSTDDLEPEQIMPNLGTFALENYLISFFGFKNNSVYKIIHPISIEYSTD